MEVSIARSITEFLPIEQQPCTASIFSLIFVYVPLLAANYQVYSQHSALLLLSPIAVIGTVDDQQRVLPQGCQSHTTSVKIHMPTDSRGPALSQSDPV